MMGGVIDEYVIQWQQHSIAADLIQAKHGCGKSEAIEVLENLINDGKVQVRNIGTGKITRGRLLTPINQFLAVHLLNLGGGQSSALSLFEIDMGDLRQLLGSAATERLKSTESPDEARKRGRTPKVRDRVVAEMRLLDRAALNAMLEKEFEPRFGASRTTCREARNVVRSENVGN